MGVARSELECEYVLVVGEQRLAVIQQTYRQADDDELYVLDCARNPIRSLAHRADCEEALARHALPRPLRVLNSLVQKLAWCGPIDCGLFQSQPPNSWWTPIVAIAVLMPLSWRMATMAYDVRVKRIK